MTQSELLESLFNQAVRAIPYDLEPTSITMGELGCVCKLMERVCILEA